MIAVLLAGYGQKDDLIAQTAKKVAGIKLDQATGEMKTVFVIDHATSAFQPLIGPKELRVLRLSNFKRNVDVAPLTLALFTGNDTVCLRIGFR